MVVFAMTIRKSQSLTLNRIIVFFQQRDFLLDSLYLFLYQIRKIEPVTFEAEFFYE